jgi:hypothetical protein
MNKIDHYVFSPLYETIVMRPHAVYPEESIPVNVVTRYNIANNVSVRLEKNQFVDP